MVDPTRLVKGGALLSRRAHAIRLVVGWAYVCAWAGSVVWIAKWLRPAHPTAAVALSLVAGMLAPAAPSLVKSYDRYVEEWRRSRGGE